jgi:hypothetical protein
MTTHEGADMPTHPEVVTLDPNDPDDMARLGRAATNADKDDCPRDADFGINVFRLLAAPPEPPTWTVVRVNAEVFLRHDLPGASRWYMADLRIDSSRTWPEVCALGIPEVLEPEAVKALREQVTNLAAEGVVAEAERDEARAAVRKMQDHHGECICITAGPALEGPDEYCPWHGRPWDDMLEHYDRMVTEARATVARVETIRDRWATSENAHALWCEINDALKWRATEDEPAEPAPVEAAPFGWVNPENTRIRLNPDDGTYIYLGAPDADEEPVWLTLARPAAKTGGQS